MIGGSQDPRRTIKAERMAMQQLRMNHYPEYVELNNQARQKLGLPNLTVKAHLSPLLHK